MSSKACAVEISKTNTYSDGSCRRIYFYDEKGNSIGFTYFYGPLFTEDVTRQAVPAGHDLVGVSVTLGASGSWVNFLTMPSDK